MINEEIQKFESLTGNNANDFSISYVGGYLDGYEKGKQELKPIDPSFVTDLDDIKGWIICGYRVEDLIKLSLILRDKDINELDLRDYNESFVFGYRTATEEFNKALEESINKCIKEAADNGNK